MMDCSEGSEASESDISLEIDFDEWLSDNSDTSWDTGWAIPSQYPWPDRWDDEIGCSHFSQPVASFPPPPPKPPYVDSWPLCQFSSENMNELCEISPALSAEHSGDQSVPLLWIISLSVGFFLCGLLVVFAWKTRRLKVPGVGKTSSQSCYDSTHGGDFYEDIPHIRQRAMVVSPIGMEMMDMKSFVSGVYPGMSAVRRGGGAMFVCSPRAPPDHYSQTPRQEHRTYCSPTADNTYAPVYEEIPYGRERPDSDGESERVHIGRTASEDEFAEDESSVGGHPTTRSRSSRSRSSEASDFYCRDVDSSDVDDPCRSLNKIADRRLHFNRGRLSNRRRSNSRAEYYRRESEGSYGVERPYQRSSPILPYETTPIVHAKRNPRKSSTMRSQSTTTAAPIPPIHSHRSSPEGSFQWPSASRTASDESTNKHPSSSQTNQFFAV